MSWPCASHAIWFIVLLVSVSAQQQPQAPDSSTEIAAARPTVSSQEARSIIFGGQTFLSSVSNDQLAQVKAASAFQGSLETLAAQLDADDDLVSSTLCQLLWRHIFLCRRGSTARIRHSRWPLMTIASCQCNIS
jgi:hypothetical protein